MSRFLFLSAICWYSALNVATNQGRRLLNFVDARWECGTYMRAATIRGRLLIEEIRYARIKWQDPPEACDDPNCEDNEKIEYLIGNGVGTLPSEDDLEISSEDEDEELKCENVSPQIIDTINFLCMNQELPLYNGANTMVPQAIVKHFLWSSWY